MIDKLKSMGPNNGPAQVNDRLSCSSKDLVCLKKLMKVKLIFVGIQVNDVVAAGQELDEEMMSKLSNMKVNMSSMNSPM